MAAMQCPGCKVHLQVSHLTECPRCHAAFTESAAIKPPSTAGDLSMGMKVFTFAGIFVIAVLAVTVGKLMFFPSTEKAEAEARKQLVSAALAKCQKAIISTAKYGDSETPPHSKNFGNGDEFYFAWPAGSFHFSNGFGAKEKMSASCLGTLSTGAITAITINGKQLM